MVGIPLRFRVPPTIDIIELIKQKANHKGLAFYNEKFKE